MSEKGFKPGEKSPKTAIYYCKAEENKVFKLNITEGSEFPECEGCGEKKTLWVTKEKCGK